MRTTLTLDDDVAAELERLKRTQGKRFKAIVNDALRRGLREHRPAGPKKPIRTQSVWLGQPRLANVDNIAEVLSFAEGEDFK
jgi:hypothetical protein